MSSTDRYAGALVLVLIWIGVPPAAAAVSPTTGSPNPIRIGLVEASGTSAGSLATGAEAAVREINGEGGMQGRPLELVRLQAKRAVRASRGHSNATHE